MNVAERVRWNEAGNDGTFVRRTIVFVQSARNRRLIYLLAAIVFAVLVFFPRPFVARAKIVPQDTATSSGTSSLGNMLGGQTASFASLLTGGRASNDLYLIIGRSDGVADRVIKSLNLVGPSGPYRSVDQARRKLSRKTDIHLLLGGVMEVEVRSRRPDEAQRLAEAYVTAISKQLASFGRQLIQNKRTIVTRRFEEAGLRLARAEGALNSFRRNNNLAEPEEELSGALGLRAQLEADLQGKLVELREAQEFKGPENPELLGLQTQIEELRRRIAQTTTTQSVSPGGATVAGLSALQTRYLSLYRDYKFAQTIYEVYSRAFEQVSVEELAAESASYVQVIDPAHVDSERHWNAWAVAALMATVLLALFTEWYAPATGFFASKEGEASKTEHS